ncbi:MAG TPA: exosortase/archaeosortase family protein [Lacipirellula sp.]
MPLAALAAAAAWAYFDTLQALAIRWSNEAAYGHGFLVPCFSVFLLWYRRDMLVPPYTASTVGLIFIGLAAAMRLVAAYWYYALLEPYSIVPMAAGVCLLTLGYRGLQWAWPSIVFLTFMVPLPGRIADILSDPLQRIATIASTYVIQLLGIPALAEGNVIVLTHAKIGVIEACNGLRMLILFFAVAAGAAMILRGPAWLRWTLFASAVPIALAANILRIAATALAHEYASTTTADWLFHDVAAWLMMPLAILMLLLEVAFLNCAFPDRQLQGPVVTD